MTPEERIIAQKERTRDAAAQKQLKRKAVAAAAVASSKRSRAERMLLTDTPYFEVSMVMPSSPSMVSMLQMEMWLWDFGLSRFSLLLAMRALKSKTFFGSSVYTAMPDHILPGRNASVDRSSILLMTMVAVASSRCDRALLTVDVGHQVRPPRVFLVDTRQGEVA